MNWTTRYAPAPALIMLHAALSGCASPAAPEQTIAEATGGKLTAMRGSFAEAGCNEILDYEAAVVDLNGDGQPEVFISIRGFCLGGGAGEQMNLYIRDSHGRWQPQFGFPGIPILLRSGHDGFPDIEVGGPGFCFPVWRWNGHAYAPLQSCPL